MDEKIMEYCKTVRENITLGMEVSAGFMILLEKCEYLLSLLSSKDKEIEELEKSLTIKILENAKGAQVLFDAEARIKEFEKKFTCGHRKIDWDDSYGNCVVCTLKEYADKYDDQLGLELKVKELEDAINNAQKDNPDEIHCTCVPLLKTRIKELKEGIKFLVDGEILCKPEDPCDTCKEFYNLIKKGG